MATLANTGMANQMAFGQHGSAFIDGASGAYTAPTGKVVVAIQFLAQNSFSALTPEATSDCFGLAANSGQGTNHNLIDSSNLFPKGITVYGRWTEVRLNTADSDGGAILYFGPAKEGISTT